MKTPKQIRDDIRTLTVHLNQVREGLQKRSSIVIADIGKECHRTAQAIGELLKAQELPDDYKVAVVGRFKTGKSSFVNELLGARLASEDTNPETAAITSFRYGEQVKAIVRFVPESEWLKLQNLYSEDSKHIDAHRIKVWKTFANKKNKDGKADDGFNLSELERLYIKPNSHQIEIYLKADGTKKAETEFRKQLKEFTSGARPLHCLVQSIEITSPASILQQGVLLIDTPGLDDTERFRVYLTEQTVEDVDAVLFLTKSGASYGQSEKDFLLTLLRKGTVKQLLVVITQIDQTYAQHTKAAEDGDEDPESLAQRIEKERTRIANEINATLNDLSQDDSPAIRQYREQLGDVQIVFTSAFLHRDWKANKPIPCEIHSTDPGGIETLKSQLLQLLSTESRLAKTAYNISTGASTHLLDLQAVLEQKLLAIRHIKNKEVAEQKLHTFRNEFGKASAQFEKSVKQQVILLEDRLKEKRRQHIHLVEKICLIAEKQLAVFRTNDVGRHWRSRRSGYWGYMIDFQERIANQIFPDVQKMLHAYTSLFASFADNFEVYLDSLSKNGAKISASLELGSTMPFDVTVKLKESLGRTHKSAQELISKEELRITTILDNFVTDEVSERITERRSKVSNIWGVGTTQSQSKEVISFYDEIERLLSEALQTHLKARTEEFCNFLILEAQTAPRDALNQVQVLLEQAADNIRAAATTVLEAEKERVQSYVQEISTDCAETLGAAQRLQLMIVEATSVKDSGYQSDTSHLNTTEIWDEQTSFSGVPKSPVSTSDQINISNLKQDDTDWVNRVQRNATVIVNRIRLHEGTTGWPYSKLFDPHFLKGATCITLIDPYLASPHQMRNLNEFLLHIADTARPKTIDIVTRIQSVEQGAYQERLVNETAKSLFRDFGISLTLRRDTGLHDRYLILDHGVLFKLGRGLDIYKPATGLASHRPAIRKVRETEIDIFTTPERAELA